MPERTFEANFMNKYIMASDLLRFEIYPLFWGTGLPSLGTLEKCGVVQIRRRHLALKT